MVIRSKKKFSRKVTNKKNKSKRSKSKKERTRKQNIRKQGGGGGGDGDGDDKVDELFQHGSICTDKDPKFLYVNKTYRKSNRKDNKFLLHNKKPEPKDEPKILICKKSLKMPFSKKKRSSTLPSDLQIKCLDKPCYHITTKFDRRGKKNKEMVKKVEKEHEEMVDKLESKLEELTLEFHEIIQKHEKESLKKDLFYEECIQEIITTYEKNKEEENFEKTLGEYRKDVKSSKGSNTKAVEASKRIEGNTYDGIDNKSIISYLVELEKTMKHYTYNQNKNPYYNFKVPDLLKLFYYKFKNYYEYFSKYRDKLRKKIDKTIQTRIEEVKEHDYQSTIIENEIKKRIPDIIKKYYDYKNIKMLGNTPNLDDNKTPIKFYDNTFFDKIDELYDDWDHSKM
jgi:hypothetical protein